MMLTADERGRLWQAAENARAASYSPYSKITVGAALLCENGQIYTGANIENSAYSPSVCAERVAIFKAINDGVRGFRAIAVAGGPQNAPPRREFPPCGVCRQVMSEFCDGHFEVILSDGGESVSFGELLPFGFGKEHL